MAATGSGTPTSGFAQLHKDCALVFLGFLAALLLSGFPIADVVFGEEAPASGAASGAAGRPVTAGGAAGGRVALGVDRAGNGHLPHAGGAAPRSYLPEVALVRDFCRNVSRMPSEPIKYDVMGQPDSSEDTWEKPVCHWAYLSHPAVPMKPLNMCTHDPSVDTVISRFLHEYHFWGSPDDYLILLATGPCTPERPYMLDIGANLGLFTILGASRGCRVVGFEPLSQNILRVRESLKASGWDHLVLMYKHAVGKFHQPVSIGFRASNPGASAINTGGDSSEDMHQITIDGLLMGPTPPKFEAGPGQPPLPPVLGQHINFAKIDTEGYDVAVVNGAIHTLIAGRVPHILIEFTPGDAAGTAGCDPVNFVRLLYANGYRMYEQSRAEPLKSLIETEIPRALRGDGKRVFEAWFIHDDAAVGLMEMGLLAPFAV